MKGARRLLLAHRPPPADLQALVDHLVPDGDTWLHRFEPVGVSIARIGASSSVVVHTWPERGVLTLDGYGAASVGLPARVQALGWHVLE